MFLSDSIIYKVVLSLRSQQIVLLPKGTTILSCRIQKMQPCVWFMLPFESVKSENLERHAFMMIETGTKFKNMPTNAKFLTTLDHDGAILHVFHAVFENVEDAKTDTLRGESVGIDSFYPREGSA